MMKRIFQDKKVIMTILSILLVLSIMTSTTYSLLFKVDTLENLESYTAGDLTINVTKGKTLTLNDTLPMSDEDGEKLEPYIFTIKNTGNITYTFDVKLFSATNGSKTIDYNYIKLKIDGGNVVKFGNLIEGLIYENIKLPPGQEVSIAVRAWLDYKTPNTEIGKNFSAKIVIDGIGTEAPYKDGSGANTPDLLEGMVPVEYVGNNWQVADITTEWYNYSEQRWANAVLVTEDSGLREAEPGTVVSESDVLAYYVWIPRYKYQLFNPTKTMGVDNYNAQGEGINIEFESGTATTGTVKCSLSSTGKETCTNANGNSWYTHPAFWWDSNDNGTREANEELTGIWIGKFELSSSDPSLTNGGDNTTDLDVRIIPNVYSWRNNSISNFFKVIQNMTGNDNSYGLSSKTADSHMIRNMEWGAVAYFTNSKYGRCPDAVCVEVTRNASPSYKTGRGDYSNKQWFGTSTTKNITGVYDMSGGSNEFVMTNSINFNVASSLFDPQPNLRYYDIYVSSSSITIDMFKNGRLGDATAEVLASFVGGTDKRGKSWYDDYGALPTSNSPFLRRGGVNTVDTSGIFNYSYVNGSPVASVSTRAILIRSSY